MEVVVTLLLLVAGSWCCAGAGILSPGQRRDVTSPMDRTTADAQSAAINGLSRLRVFRNFPSLAVEHGPVSVVQDWSLVCVQLCGAALGGETCAPYCASVTVPESVQISNAEILLSPNRDVICEDLCTLKLGGNICKCSIVTSSRSVQARNQVCQSFCLHNRETLAGCSICNLIQPITAWASRHVDNETVNSSEDIDAEVNVASGNPATDPTTTPDWDALCVTLCKTGDGGSLCNCDLSPFF